MVSISPTGIDPATGLAKLPEGYYWEVTEGMYLGDTIFYLKIMGETVETTTHTPWFRKPYTTEKRYPTSIHNGYVWEFNDHGSDERYSGGFANYLTPDYLLYSSVRELEKCFENARAAQDRLNHEEESKKLLGNYPPKSINRKETP